MNAGVPSRMPSRGLLWLAVAALVFGVRYDAYAYGNHRDKTGEGALVEHAEGLPDLSRGREAAAAGRLEDAEADLKPLAERGYVEAQISLASLYAHVGTPERVALAIGWLRKARDSSPLDTETPLGRLLIRQNDDASIDEGLLLLGNAWQQRHDPEALAGLIHVYSDHPRRDRDHQVASLVAQAEQIGTPPVQGAIIDWYRSTRADDGHADKLVSLCERWLDQSQGCYVDLARAARVGADAKRLQWLVSTAGTKYDSGLVDAQTLASLARVLAAPLASGADDEDDDSDASAPAVRVSDVTEDPGELSENAIQAQAQAAQQAPGPCTRVVLTPTAAAGGAASAAPAGVPAQPELANTVLGKLLDGAGDAPILAAGVVTRFPYLLPSTDIESRLKQGVEQGIPEASLYLGQLYLSGGRTPRDPRLALQYLQQAAGNPATALKAHYELGRLYEYGYLDESRPLLAAQYLMWSARRGDVGADSALARLFSSGKGLCPNLSNAYVFARLGAREGSASSAQLAQQIAAQLSAEQIAGADRMYTAELAVRPSAYRIPATMLAEAAAIARAHGVAVASADAMGDASVDASDDVPSAAVPVDEAPLAAAASDAQQIRPATDDVDLAPTPASTPTPTPTDTAASDIAPVGAAPAIAAAGDAQGLSPPTDDADLAPPSDAPPSATPSDAAASAAASSAAQPAKPSPPREAVALQYSERRLAPAAMVAAQPAHEPQPQPQPLSHRPSDDPAVRALLDAPRSAAQAAPPPSPPRSRSPADANTIEYIVPLQVPASTPAVPVPPRSGDPS